jgi:outer membrane protein
MDRFKFLIAPLCVCLLMAPGASFGQDRYGKYGIVAPQDLHWYSGFVHRYTVPDIPPANFSNSRRLESLVRAGKIYLSLQDAIALAIENNLDIEVQRYQPKLAEANLLRAQAGGLLRGLSSTVASGPSSVLSQLTGTAGTTGITNFSSASPATSTSNGTIITSTGTTIPTLDETLFANYTWGHHTTPQSNSFSTGIPSSISNSGNGSFGVQRGFLSGTTATMQYTQQDITSNNVRSEINPVNTGALSLNVTQHLLQGFGFAVNNRNIRIAKNSIKISELTFEQQLISTVASVINLYTDLVSYVEAVKVQEEAVGLNQKLYSDNKKQVEIGTLAPIEIIRAEAELASSEQTLVQAQTAVLQQEIVLKTALSRTGTASPVIAEAHIVPTDQLRIPDVEAVAPVQDRIETALRSRPEMAQTELNIVNTKIQMAGTKSELLPTLDLTLGATNNALAGDPNTIPIPAGQAFFPRIPDPNYVGGIGSVLAQIFRRNYPDYTVGFQLNVPLRNRAAEADIINDTLTLRQAELQQRKQINQIRADVQNSVIGLRQYRAQYLAAQKARALQEQTLDAERKKYALGASTVFLVIQAQRDLTLAQSNEVLALSAYNHARVSLDVATGQLLEHYNIQLDDAMKGKVTTAPSPLPVLDEKNGKAAVKLPAASVSN